MATAVSSPVSDSSVQFRVGDVVDTRWGITTIDRLERTAPGEKYGIDVDEIYVGEAGVADLGNGHWCYLEQIESTVASAAAHPVVRILQLALADILAAPSGEMEDGLYTVRWRPDGRAARHIRVLGPRQTNPQIVETVTQLAGAGWTPLKFSRLTDSLAIHFRQEVA